MPSFLNVNTRSFYPTGGARIASPATGTSMYLWSGENMITGSGTIAALTAKMPIPVSPGAQVTLMPTVAVTALTLQDAAGNAVAGAPAALVANQQVKLMWTGTAWVRQT